ncbi:thioesterase family protein [Bradyrhizobium sp. LHD-71]|uniref:thioesterase family protein n=1 Tax=Bradyrhizobium sp. LHD-71 TaxID=3072141 RepID=UPI00280C8CEF|nr:thioesterase family protein [Bradyrhizobium sp. LHD-71]MDQ8732028.1 thioesterase family protein [Bradyrhizobium sp. LHD-71]
MTPTDLQPGLRHRQQITVTEMLTVPAVSTAFTGFTDMPPVFATAFMVAFVEWTCIEALRPHLAPHLRTVGTHVDMSHIGATPVGVEVTAEVELVAIERRHLRFRVECRDAIEVIGRGFHERTIVDGSKFVERLRRKSAKRVPDV